MELKRKALFYPRGNDEETGLQKLHNLPHLARDKIINLDIEESLSGFQTHTL